MTCSVVGWASHVRGSSLCCAKAFCSGICFSNAVARVYDKLDSVSDCIKDPATSYGG